MKYVITNPNNNAVRLQRVFVADPRELPKFSAVVNRGEVHEVTDAEGDTLQQQLDELQNGDLPIFDSVTNTVTVSPAVTQIEGQVVRRQLDILLSSWGPGVRSKFIQQMAPYLGPKNWTAMKTALQNYDVSDKPAKVQQLKTDLITVVDRAIAEG